MLIEKNFVLLPSNKPTHTGLFATTNGLTYVSELDVNLSFDEISMQIYIYDSVKPSLGDWYIDFKRSNPVLYKRALIDDSLYEKCYKVIVSSDVELNMLTLSSDFLREFAERSRDDNPISSLFVSYNDVSICESSTNYDDNVVVVNGVVVFEYSSEYMDVLEKEADKHRGIAVSSDNVATINFSNVRVGWEEQFKQYAEEFNDDEF